VISDLSTEAQAFGTAARRAFAAAGGFDAGDGAVAAALDGLGAWDLDVRSGPDELEAAAALCRAAGWWAVPHPIAERLARPTDVAEVDALAVVAAREPAVAALGGDVRWLATTVEGRRGRATARRPEPIAPALGVPVDLEPLDEAGAADVPLALVLPVWTLLGMLDRAIDLTCAYVGERHQFGQPLSSFQGVQFQLTDAEVERVGLEELAKYALWSIEVGRPDALADALALRAAAIEAAEVVFRVTHQLHGAIGFCDESDLSWVSRRSQPLRRLPFGLSATRELLVGVVGRRGLGGLFS
jgi:hypothetical protein